MAEVCEMAQCTCEARDDGYCSDACAARASGDRRDGPCECGHAGCDATAPAAESQVG